MWTLPLTVPLLVTSLMVVVTAETEKMLVFRLLDRYTSVSGRPVANASQPVNLKVGLSLVRLDKLDQDAQTLSMKVFLRMMWKDDFLTWDPAEYDGVTRVAMNQEDIWTPDMELFNAKTAPKSMMMTPLQAVVTSDGNVNLESFLDLTSHCPTRRDSMCKLIIGSMVYNDNQVKLEVMEDGVDLSYYRQSVDWEFEASSAQVSYVFFECCLDDRFPSAHFKITFKARSQESKPNMISAGGKPSDLSVAMFSLVLPATMLLLW